MSPGTCFWEIIISLMDAAVLERSSVKIFSKTESLNTFRLRLINEAYV